MLPSSIMSQLQEATLFEILSIPYTSTGWTLTDGLGTLRSSASITPAATVLPEIEAFFTGGTVHGITYPVMDTGVLAYVLTSINRWIDLGSTVTRIVEGGVSDITKITDDPRDERALLREKVRNAVPFLTRYAYLIKEAGDGVSSSSHGGGSSSVEVIH